MLVDGSGGGKASVTLINESQSEIPIHLPIGTTDDAEAILTNTDTSVSFICKDVAEGTYSLKIVTYPDGGSDKVEIEYASTFKYS